MNEDCVRDSKLVTQAGTSVYSTWLLGGGNGQTICFEPFEMQLNGFADE
jgi:hypothetical protein